jgi:hypothetical protein
MIIPRLCLFCEHFHFSSAEQGYSEYTPGYEAVMNCNKNKWKYDLHDTRFNLDDALLTAVNCKHYKINPWAKERYHIEEE